MDHSTYEEAGVSIDRADRFTDLIKPLAQKTMRPEVLGGIGGFGALFALGRYEAPILVSGTDGVGTKLKIAFALDRHDTVGIDLVAMCVNDILVQGAEPLFFLDYFAASKLDLKVGEAVITGISQGCLEAGCALVGGETAEMPGMYQEGEYDLAGFAVGVVEKKNLLPKTNITSGDILLALPSSGLHSNGFSLVRRILEKKGFSLEKDFHGQTLGEVLLTPTRIYVKIIQSLLANHAVKGLAHITGGGIIENIPRILPPACGVSLERTWDWPEIFLWLEKEGHIDRLEMLRTFNCGIGMVVVIAKEEADRALAFLQGLGEAAFMLGEVKEGALGIQCA